MDIEEYKLRYGYKELPWHFYLRGVLFWTWLMVIPLSILWYLFDITYLHSFAILIPWCIFWSWKAVRKMEKDKLKVIE